MWSVRPTVYSAGGPMVTDFQIGFVKHLYSVISLGDILTGLNPIAIVCM